ncbi:CCS dismutase, partial [Glaucidium brasilianum]|nr:CCS dismutase [Glaucidium brasilianum]
LEFAVQMRCQGGGEAVRAALGGAPDGGGLELRLDAQTVLVETGGGAERVRELLEASGRRGGVKGMGGPDDGQLGLGGGWGGVLEGFGVPTRVGGGSPGAAAVAAVAGPGGGGGLVRFLQVSPGRCGGGGAVEGLPPGPHGLQGGGFGDLSHPCD